MTLPSETVTLAGSGLVFVNSYGAAVDATYRSEVLAAENFLQSHFVNAVTINIAFDKGALGPSFTARNSFFETQVSYSQLAGALQSHAVTADDRLAVAGLPTFDPSHGTGFQLPTAYATMLGLAQETGSQDMSVTLNNDAPLTAAEAIGVIEHEITEGGFGRTASLGFEDGGWEPLDLFRFTAGGQRDFTGGQDGVRTFFGVDAGHVTSFAFHNAISAGGLDDGFDLGDWDVTVGDAFGPSGPGNPGAISATDLQVLDVLGWTPSGAAGATAGQVINGAAGGDTIQAPESNDTITGGSGGANYLRGNGGDDSIQGGAAFDDINGNKGDDTIDGGSGGSDWLVGGQGNDSIVGHHTGNLILGNLGNDTLISGDGIDVVRGGQGDDSIVGGSGNDFISGDLGNDTESGGGGADIFHGSVNVGIDRVLDFNYAQGDRVELDPGTAFSVSQVAGDTVVNLGGGNEMILVGVQLSTLPSDWIFSGTLSHL